MNKDEFYKEFQTAIVEHGEVFATKIMRSKVKQRISHIFDQHLNREELETAIYNFTNDIMEYLEDGGRDGVILSEAKMDLFIERALQLQAELKEQDQKPESESELWARP